MLKAYNYDIVFQEIPDQVTLAINITGCPNRCPGCHSQFLWDDVGEPLTADTLDAILAPYLEAVTCVSFMGGDHAADEIDALAAHVRSSHKGLLTAWYSGRTELDHRISLANFDYIKLGPYIESLGPLKQPTTNQRLYRIGADGQMQDITHRFWKH